MSGLPDAVVGAFSASQLLGGPSLPIPGVGSRPGGLAKAYIDIEGQDTIKCWFNPNRYTISKSNSWQETPVTGTSLPKVQFGGGQSRKLSLELFLDDSEDASGDVTRMTDRLFKAMEVDDSFRSSRNSARPPSVTFGWGAKWTFKAVIEELSVDFTLFRPDGVPVRATAKLSLRQAAHVVGAEAGADAEQNPKTRGVSDLGARTVREGDSLQSIAQDVYRDPTKWRTIADANGIDDPMNLPRGTQLAIPQMRG